MLWEPPALLLNSTERERGVYRVECVEWEMAKAGVSSSYVGKLTLAWWAKYRLHSNVEIHWVVQNWRNISHVCFLTKCLEPSSSSSSRVKETRWQFQSDEGACYSASQARSAWKARNNWENNPPKMPGYSRIVILAVHVVADLLKLHPSIQSGGGRSCAKQAGIF